MATLYVTEQGARLEREYRRILVSVDDRVLMAVPVARLSDIVLVGRVGATTPALTMLLDAGVGLCFVTRTGRLRGRLTPPRPKNLPLRHAQYRAATDPAMCLAISHAVVAGKLANTRVRARRLLRAHPDLDPAAIERILASEAKVPDADNLASLRGLEGVAARAYFCLYRAALRPAFRFDRRSRRPPRDPANALLSFGYTLLTQNLMTACEIVGLDPYDGFFHADKYGRPSLALDLCEEFRAPVVDSVVQTAINKGIVRATDFAVARDGGMRLGRRGLRRFLRAYTARLETPAYHPYADRALTYSRSFELQARLLAKTVTGELDAYRPLRVR